MSEYHLAWITDSLAAGHAPMSYEELASIREQGIDSIVNLCGEFTDLHLIEEEYGFDVYHIPLADETAPDIDEMDRCVEWIDESIFLGKKVLVHCHHGIGRTGTVITAYLLRKGLGMKVAAATLKLRNARANPANYAQWRLVRRYGKAHGRLKIREPALEMKRSVDLGNFFLQYEALVQDIEQGILSFEKNKGRLKRCGLNTDSCCASPFDLWFIEAIYLMHNVNTVLKSRDRQKVRRQAARVSLLVKKYAGKAGAGHEIFAAHHIYQTEDIKCPLCRDERCLLYDKRPTRCRFYGVPAGIINISLYRQMLEALSKEIFFALTGEFSANKTLEFSSLDAISGKFMERFFTMSCKHKG